MFFFLYSMRTKFIISFNLDQVGFLLLKDVFYLKKTMILTHYFNFCDKLMKIFLFNFLPYFSIKEGIYVLQIY